MVNVRALPSDLARLVLDYLYSEGLQESYDVFLQESAHLEELRNFPAMGILPLGAKSLQVIVEEYYELTAQDTSKVKNANDALYKLWKRFDALLLQIKHQYKASGSIATVTNELASQSVRSRYSLYRLHHERMQMEREQTQRQINNNALTQSQQHHQLQEPQQQQQQPPRQMQEHQQCSQQQIQQLHQQPKYTQHQRHNSPFRRQQCQDFEPDTHHRMVSSPISTNQQRQEGSCDTLSSVHRPASPSSQEALSTSPSQSVTSTQSQFVTPTKSSLPQRADEGEKVIGKSPKRKSVPPRRKPQAAGPLDRVYNAPSTSTGITPVDDIQNLPSPWGSLCNNRELMEKLADNINKVLPTQEISSHDESVVMEDEPPTDQANLSAGTVESQHSRNRSQALDDLLGGMVSESMMEEFVDMTSGDPAFNSLFALFNTDRDNFLSSERKKMQSSAAGSEIEDNLNSSKESEVGSSVQQTPLAPTSQPNQHPPQPSPMPSSSPVSTVCQEGNKDTMRVEPSKSQRSETAGHRNISSPYGTVTIISQGRNERIQGKGHVTEVVGQNNISSTNEERVFLDDELEGLSSTDQNPFPNVVVRSSPLRDDAACTSTNMSCMSSGMINESTNAAAGLSKGNSKPLIKASFSDFFSRSRIRNLSIRNPSPTKESMKTSESSSRVSRNTNSRRKAKSKAASSRVQEQNERTPSKKRTDRTPERMYSPEEKAVARLLTKLPTTPTKENMVATSQSVVVDGKNVVIVRREKSGVANHGLSGAQTGKAKEAQGLLPSAHTSVHNSLSVDGNLEGQSRPDQVVASSAVANVNGFNLSSLPGHERTAQINLASKRETSATPAHQSEVSVIETQKRDMDIETVRDPPPVHSRTTDPALCVRETKNETNPQGLDNVKVEEDHLENGVKPKKGVKRDRKEGDKGKGSKKTKRSKSKTSKDLGFPINMDVDKFLSQINYTS